MHTLEKLTSLSLSFVNVLMHSQPESVGELSTASLTSHHFFEQLTSHHLYISRRAARRGSKSKDTTWPLLILLPPASLLNLETLFSTKGGFYWLRMEHQKDTNTMSTHPASAELRCTQPTLTHAHKHAGK